MALTRTRILGRVRAVVVLVVLLSSLAMLAVSCSSDDPADDDSAAPAGEETADDGSDSDASSGDTGDGSAGDGDVDAADDSDDSEPDEPTPEPSLEDENLAEITDLQSGEQVRDAHGNLITVHGAVEWPTGFADLTTDARASFPFFADLAGVSDPAVRLVALDVAMCAAGIDGDGSGAGEFFAAATADEPLSRDPDATRSVPATHPVRTPSFEVPSAATCDRGWLPVSWADSVSPGTARYVLETASEPGADLETYVYQWSIDVSPTVPGGSTETSDATEDAAELDIDRTFRAGETVQFTEGRLDGTTVQVNGWAELLDEPPAIDGTRTIAVSFEVCPAASEFPAFGIGVDGWNIVAPIDAEVFLGTSPAAGECIDGWMPFAIPLGTVPTAFFASDGLDPTTGYAEWSLAEAAIAAPTASE